MLRYLSAVIIMLGCLGLPVRAEHDAGGGALAFHTFLYFDAAARVQVEYLDGDGRAYLWFPGEERVIGGFWRETAEGDVCFAYDRAPISDPSIVNPDAWICEGWETQRDVVVAKRSGDLFDLRSGVTPFVLGFDAFFADFETLIEAGQ